MLSLWFALRKTNLRLIPPVADCLFRQQPDTSCSLMLVTQTEAFARFIWLIF
jgi:hypothetical protein